MFMLANILTQGFVLSCYLLASRLIYNVTFAVTKSDSPILIEIGQPLQFLHYVINESKHWIKSGKVI